MKNTVYVGSKPVINYVLGTEELETEDGTRNVSTIEITLSKSHGADEPRGREPTTEAERLPEREQRKVKKHE